MNKIAIVYWSGTGNTEIMANAIKDGILSADTKADLFTASAFSPEKAKEYDCFAFGCPSMGVEVLEEYEFEPMFNAIKPILKDKTIGLFGSYGWGDGEWMCNWVDDCVALGCKIVSDPVIAHETPDENAILLCKDLGSALEKA